MVAVLGAEDGGGGRRSRLCAMSLLFLAPSQLPVGFPWPLDAGVRGIPTSRLRFEAGQAQPYGGDEPYRSAMTLRRR